MLYHYPDMKIPLANAIYEKKANLKDILKLKNGDYFSNKKFHFFKINNKNFPAIKFVNLIDKFPSSSIILNAGNEILVDLFLKKIIQFNSIIKYLSSLLRDKNYKKYAIKKPKNINEILIIDSWARERVLKKIYLK